ncbi:MAG: beta-lactamase family protein [Mariniphaga sp.]|nr:beta-lactamase family protein [Mariniphaga sp.]
MFRNKRALILIAIIIIGITILRFQRHPRTISNTIIPEPRIDSTLINLKTNFEAYETIFQRGIKNCSCPGSAVVVVKDTSVVFIKGYGNKHARTKNPIDEHTVFRLGSLSKGFASVTAGMMVEQGYFSWDDKVKDFYPEFELKSKEQSERIKIQHILSHTTGLIRHAYTNLIEEGWSIDKIAAILNEVDLISEEGESFAYQNATFSLIEKVIESSTGKEYSEILQQELLSKSGMLDASCTYEGLKQSKNKSQPHALVARNYIYNKTRITKKYYNSISSGGVNASITDMGNWLKVLLGNRPDIISKETLDKIFQPVIRTTHERRFYDNWKETSNSYYAMGLRVLDFNGRKVIYHGGFVNGYRSEIAIDTENGVAVCALFNASCDYAKFVVRDFLNFYDAQFLNPTDQIIANNQD